MPAQSKEAKRIWREKLQNTKRLQYENTPFEELGMENRRRRIADEQKCKCARCEIDTWLGEKLTLELEHKDGDNTNNKRENLDLLCPNCHSLTTTWRGRNKKRKKLSDQEIIDALSNHDTIRQALLSLGVAAKGSNYARAQKLLILLP